MIRVKIWVSIHVKIRVFIHNRGTFPDSYVDSNRDSRRHESVSSYLFIAVVADSHQVIIQCVIYQDGGQTIIHFQA